MENGIVQAVSSVHGAEPPLDGGIRPGCVLAVSAHAGTGLHLSMAQTVAWAARAGMVVTILDQDGWSKHLARALGGSAVVSAGGTVSVNEEEMSRGEQ